VTVTFITTADAAAGTPPRPPTCTLTVAPGPIAPLSPPAPSRVSSIRAGLKAVYRPWPALTVMALEPLVGTPPGKVGEEAWATATAKVAPSVGRWTTSKVKLMAHDEPGTLTGARVSGPEVGVTA
jgi:hypothetical protein